MHATGLSEETKAKFFQAIPKCMFAESSDLRNCVVWITGASGGIGEKLAYEMSKCGSTVVLSSRNKEQLEKVAEKCRGAN